MDGISESENKNKNKNSRSKGWNPRWFMHTRARGCVPRRRSLQVTWASGRLPQCDAMRSRSGGVCVPKITTPPPPAQQDPKTSEPPAGISVGRATLVEPAGGGRGVVVRGLAAR